MRDAEFTLSNGGRVSVRETDIPGVDRGDLIARSVARYYLVAFFCRPWSRVLDFPCGSGYAADVLAPLGLHYDGLEIDYLSVEYARRMHSHDGMATFAVGDLEHPDVGISRYHVIACIEGLEHIEMSHHDQLIASLKSALKPGGILIVSSPENILGISGQSSHNPYHRGELTRNDFESLLARHFSKADIQILTDRAILSTGVRANCFYGICRNV